MLTKIDIRRGTPQIHFARCQPDFTLIIATRCLSAFTWDSVFNGKMDVMNSFSENPFLFVISLCVDYVQFVINSRLIFYETRGIICLTPSILN